MLPQQICLQLERRKVLHQIRIRGLIYAKSRLLVMVVVLVARLCSTARRSTRSRVEFFAELIGSVVVASRCCIDRLPDRAWTRRGKLHLLCLRHLHRTSSDLSRHTGFRPFVHRVPINRLCRKIAIDRTALSCQDLVIFPGDFEKLTLLKFIDAFAEDGNKILAELFGRGRQCRCPRRLCLRH